MDQTAAQCWQAGRAHSAIDGQAGMPTYAPPYEYAKHRDRLFSLCRLGRYTGTSHSARQPANPDQRADRNGLILPIATGTLQNAAHCSLLFRYALQLIAVNLGRYFDGERVDWHDFLLHDSCCLRFNCHDHTPAGTIGHPEKPRSCDVWNPELLV